MLEFLKKKRNIRIAILVATAAGLLALSYKLSAITNPLLIALLIAYILNPLVSRIEKIRIRVLGRNIGPGRTGAVISIYIGALGLIVVFFAIVIPVVFGEIKYLMFALPGESVVHEAKAGLASESEAASKMGWKRVTEPFSDVNGNGYREQDERFKDLNGNGKFDAGEPFADANVNGRWDDAEPYTDRNLNRKYDPPEPFKDADGDGKWTPGEAFHDLNSDGIFNPPEPFEDGNGNGIRDEGESFQDMNGNGRWDVNEGLVFTDSDRDGKYDPPEQFDDSDGDGEFDPGELFQDLNGNGRWDAAERFDDWNQNWRRDQEIWCPPHLTIGSEPFEDLDGNGARGEGESYTDQNGNGRYDAYFFFTDENGDGLFDLGYAYGAVLKLRELLETWNRRFPDQKIEITFESVRDEMVKQLKGSGEQFQSFSSWLLYSVKSGLMGILDIVSIFVLIPFYTFFFLKSLDGIRDSIHRNLPGMYRDRIWAILGDIHLSVSSFFRGRLAICFSVAAATWLVLVLFDVRFSLIFGVLMGVSVIVPFLSVFIVTLPVGLMLAIDGASAIRIAGAVLSLTAIQNVENFYLTPKVLGKETQLHPVTIFVSFLVGGSLFGLFGILLAVPLASIAKILGREFILPQIRALAKEQPAPSQGGETGLFERPGRE